MPSADHASNTAAPTIAITVTYGDRAHLVERVVTAALDQEIARVIIVDNASSPASRAALIVLAEKRAEHVELISLPENRGSAGGYAAGLARAAEDPRWRYAWLLDDDNVPESGALNALLRWHAQLEEAHPGRLIALASMREALMRKRSARSVDAADPFPVARPSSFLGFHWRDLANKARRTFQRKRVVISTSDEDAHTPRKATRAPYGGLFLPRATQEAIGVPDVRLFLYADDTEYTLRITRSGGLIFAIPDSRVQDVDASWDQNEEGRNSLHTFLTARSDARVYYSVRNNVFCTLHARPCNPGSYLANKLIYLGLLFATALRAGRIARFRLIRGAVRDGEAGRLGRNAALRL